VEWCPGPPGKWCDLSSNATACLINSFLPGTWRVVYQIQNNIYLYISAKFYRMEHMITESDTIQTKKDGKEIRKSLAVDPATYSLLQQICEMEHRSKIDQLKVLIQKEHKRLSSMQEHELV
jgi:hypothetical protein